MSSLLGIRIAVATAAAVATAGAGTAFAAFSAVAHASGAVSTATLTAPASATATATAGTKGSCSSVAVGWSAVAGAGSFQIQVRTTAAGSWTVADASTGNVTSWTDTSGELGSAVSYRVYSRTTQGVWTSSTAAVTAALTCTPAAPSSVTATNAGSGDVVGWAASSGATGYTVQAEIGSGSWTTIATGLTALTYTDRTQYAAGESISYRVIATANGASSADSATATVSSWSSFHVTAIELGDSSSHYTLSVTFSKAVAPASIQSTVYVTGDTVSIGSAAAGTAGVGELTMNKATDTGFSGEMTGTLSWSADDTVMTWTSTTTGGALVHKPTLSAWTAGTGALCEADGGALVSTPAPTLGGSW